MKHALAVDILRKNMCCFNCIPSCAMCIDIEKAIKTLQSKYDKEIPMKIRHPINMNGKIVTKISYCFRCGQIVKDMKYCASCGQRLSYFR